MAVRVESTVHATFQCAAERAFYTPILGDATLFLTGYGPIPAIVGFEADDTWGVPGGTRIPISKGNLFSPSGALCLDEVLSREDHAYWKWQVYDFKAWSLFFLERAVGEWTCDPRAQDIEVTWTYTLVGKHAVYRPLVWLLAKVFWNGLQRKAIRKMKELAEQGAPLSYPNNRTL